MNIDKYFRGALYTASIGFVVGCGIGLKGCPYERRLNNIYAGREVEDTAIVKMLEERRDACENRAVNIILASGVLAAIAFDVNSYKIFRSHDELLSRNKLGEEDGRDN